MSRLFICGLVIVVALMLSGAVWAAPAPASTEVDPEDAIESEAETATAQLVGDEAIGAGPSGGLDSFPKTINELRYEVNRAMAVQDWKSATQFLDAWIPLEDEESVLVVDLLHMRLALARNMREEALRIAEKVFALPNLSFDTLLTLPKVFTTLNARTASRAAAKRAAGIVEAGGGQWTAQSWFRVGLAYYDAQSIPGTLHALRRAMALDPEDSLKLAISRTLMTVGGYADAVRILNRIDPERLDMDSLDLLGSYLLNMGYTQSGLKVLQRAVLLNPKPNSWSSIANAYHALAMPKEAIPAYWQAVSHNSDSSLWVRLADAYNESDQHPQAVRGYFNLLRLVSGEACYCVNGSYKNIFNPMLVLLGLLNTQPNNALVQRTTSGLVRSLEKIEQVDMIYALLLASRVVDVQGESIGNQLLLHVLDSTEVYPSIVASLGEDNPAAAKMFTEFVRSNKAVAVADEVEAEAGEPEAVAQADAEIGDAMLRQNFSESADSAGRFADSAVLMHSAQEQLKLDPDDYWAKVLLGVAQFEDSPRSARKTLQAAMKLQPDRLLAPLLLDFYYSQEDNQKARAKLWVQASRLYPDAVSADLLRARAYNMRYQYDDAIGLYRNIMKAEPHNPAHWVELANMYSHTNRTAQLNVLYAEITQRFPTVAQQVASLMVFGVN